MNKAEFIDAIIAKAGIGSIGSMGSLPLSKIGGGAGIHKKTNLKIIKATSSAKCGGGGGGRSPI